MMCPDGYLKVKNFSKFQHYKDRRPPWIKLYISLLDDYEFLQLPDKTKWHTVAMFLLASQHDNRIPYDINFISARIGAEQPVDIDTLIKLGFLTVCKHRARGNGAGSKQNVVPETETYNEETETYTKGEAEGKGKITAPDYKNEIWETEFWSEYADKGVDTEQELFKAKNWIKANRKKRKNWNRFLTNWMNGSLKDVEPEEKGINDYSHL